MSKLKETNQNLNSSEIWQRMPSMRDISCPVNWINPMGSASNSCYYLPSGTFSGGDGLAYCQMLKMGASLINARTIVELDALKWFRYTLLYTQSFWVGARSISGLDFRWTLDLSKVTQTRTDPAYNWLHAIGHSVDPNGGFLWTPCVVDNAHSYYESIYGKDNQNQLYDTACGDLHRIVCQIEKSQLV